MFHLDLSLFYSVLLSILPYLIALSGWVTFLYNIYTSKPKIKGKIIGVMSGERDHPSKPDQEITVFFIYLYLTNNRKNVIHILDYELEIDRGKGYEKMMRFYGLQKMEKWSMESETQIFEIPNFPEKIITSEAKPLEYGIPLHGFIVFASEERHSTFHDNVKRYRVTCIDAFTNKHKITSNSKQLPSIYFLQDIAGMEIKDKASL